MIRLTVLRSGISNSWPMLILVGQPTLNWLTTTSANRRNRTTLLSLLSLLRLLQPMFRHNIHKTAANGIRRHLHTTTSPMRRRRPWPVCSNRECPSIR